MDSRFHENDTLRDFPVEMENGDDSRIARLQTYDDTGFVMGKLVLARMDIPRSTPQRGEIS